MFSLQHTFFSLFFLIIACNTYAQPIPIKVGIYNNPPKIFFDADHKPQGIYVAILEYAAKEEDLELSYVDCEWNECFEALQRGEIDILPDVAHTLEREQKVLFSREVVLSSWSVLYKHKYSHIASILDLDHKKVAIVKQSIQAQAIKIYTKRFNITPIFQEVGSFDEAFAVAQKENFDAVLTNRFYQPKENNSLFEKTDILLEPSMLKFAFTPTNETLRARIDKVLIALKQEKESLYYQELSKLLDATDSHKLPKWVYPLLTSSFLLLLVLIVLLVIFKKLLNAKTQEIEKKIVTDALTGYGTRYKLIKDLEQYTTSSLAIINIDSFREINDFFGHEFGDATILEIARTLYGYVENNEVMEFYHLQGDEFALLCKNRNKESFTTTIQTILEAIANKHFYVLSEELSLGATAGISFEKESTQLLSTADIALKNAKKKKENFMIYSQHGSLIHEYKNNLLWTKKLKEAIQENRIEAFYQGIVSNKTQKIVKYECLVRLRERDGSIVSPYHFIDIAKRTKNYITLTKIMIEKSFLMFAKTPYSFSINLTIEDILNQELLRYLLSKLEEFDACEHIIFEIVESEGIEKFKEVVEFITLVKSFGCKIAIDDFGTGYSNFEYLIELQADFIKIDGSLIKNIDKDAHARAVVSTIVSFAQKMEFQTIAEFVENEDIFMACRDLDIDFSQGYHFSKPQMTLL